MNSTNYNLIESTTTRLKDGTLAHRLVYSYTDDQLGNLKAMQFFSLKDDRVYDIVYYAKPERYNNYLPTIEKMMDSTEFAEFVPYERLIHGIVTQQPSHWKLLENNTGAAFYPPKETELDSVGEFIHISTVNSSNLPLRKIINQTIAHYKQNFTNFRVLEDSYSRINTTIGNGTSSHELTFSYNDRRDSFKVTKIFFIHNGRDYQITYFAEDEMYDNYFPTFEKVLDSFRILEEWPHNKFSFRPDPGTFGVNITYPSNWQRSEEGQNDLRLSSPPENKLDSFNENLLISIIPSGGNIDMSLEEVGSQKINELKLTYKDLKLLDSDLITTTVDGNRAFKAKYTFTDPNPEIGKIVATDIIFIRDNKEYRFAYYAQTGKELTYWPTLQKIIDSIHLEKKNVSQIDEHGISVGNSPSDIALNPVTNKLYVANSGSNTVSVIDVSTHKVKSNITVGVRPNVAVFNLATNRLYVANSGSNTVSVIDGSTDTVKGNITVGIGPLGIAVEPGEGGIGNWIFVSNSGSNTVSVIDGSTDIVRDNINVTGEPNGLEVNSITNKLYVANSGTNKVSVINYITNETGGFHYVHNIVPVGRIPTGIAVNPNTDSVYVANSGSNTVSVIDGSTDTVKKEIEVGGSPNVVAFNPYFNNDNNTVYVATLVSNIIYSIDGLNDQLKSKENITAGSIHYDIVSDPKTNTIYTADAASDRISVIDGNTKTQLVALTFNIEPQNSGVINCNDGEKVFNRSSFSIIPVNFSCESEPNPSYTFNSWYGNPHAISSNTSIVSADLFRNGAVLTASFIKIPSPLGAYGSVISTIAVFAFLLVPTILSLKPSILSGFMRMSIFKNIKKLPQLISLDETDILQIDVAIIAGVLIFLSLEGSEQFNIFIITANIVFPFATSAIVVLCKYTQFGTRLMIAGFINLIVSIILLTRIR